MGQIEDLRLFVSVVDNGSISKAAAKMNIAKSAVSRRLNLLEDRFGAHLIDRQPGAWDVTETGRELYQRALRVVSEVDEIEGDFSDTAHNLAGPLTISAPRDFGLAYLKPTLIAFTARHPEIQLVVDFDDRRIDFERENYDFAIRIAPDLNANVVATQIGTTRHQLCASPEYLAQNGKPSSPSELSDHQLLHFGTVRRARWDFASPNGKIRSIEFQPALNSNSGDFLLGAAVSALGIARLPDFIAAESLAKGDLVPVLPDIQMSEWGIFLVHSELRRLNRRMRLFAEEMKSAELGV